MGRKILLLFLVIFITASVFGDDEGLKEEIEVYKVALDFVDECGSKELSLCLKERALKYIDTLPNELEIGGAFNIKPNGRYYRKTTVENLPGEPRAREGAVETILWDRITNYLNTHSIELKVPPGTFQEMEKSVEEGRGGGGGAGGGGGGGGGGKKGGGGGGEKIKGLLLMMKMKAALLAAIALKFIALIAFKALILAKLALTISAIIGLKKLFHQKHHTSTYEVHAHPHHDIHDDYEHYDRAYKEQLAYRGYEGAARSKI